MSNVLLIEACLALRRLCRGEEIPLNKDAWRIKRFQLIKREMRKPSVYAV